MRISDWSSDVCSSDLLAATSPNRLVDRIRVPVFLAAGGEDEIAPIEQSHKMEAALKGAGVPAESLYYSTEGHGFYVPAHRIEFYQRLMGFLDRNIGQSRAHVRGRATSAAPHPCTRAGSEGHPE